MQFTPSKILYWKHCFAKFNFYFITAHTHINFIPMIIQMYITLYRTKFTVQNAFPNEHYNNHDNTLYRVEMSYYVQNYM